MRREHRVGRGTIGARARSDEAFERRQLVDGAVREQPRGDLRVAIELGERVRRRTIRAAARDIRAVLDEPFDHRHVPATGRDVQRRLAGVAPREIGVRAVIEQPAWACRIVGPLHHVDERRHAAGDAVHVQAVAVQQFERVEIAAATGDVSRDAVGGVRAGLEQHLRERQVADGADGSPQRRPGKLGMPVPVVLGVWIRAERAQTTGDCDESLQAGRIALGASTCGRRRAAAPSPAARLVAVRAPDGF